MQEAINIKINIDNNFFITPSFNLVGLVSLYVSIV